ncbi:DNA topoisomerase 6 subunit B [Orobanche gracilis]
MRDLVSKSMAKLQSSSNESPSKSMATPQSSSSSDEKEQARDEDCEELKENLQLLEKKKKSRDTCDKDDEDFETNIQDHFDPTWYGRIIYHCFKFKADKDTSLQEILSNRFITEQTIIDGLKQNDPQVLELIRRLENSEEKSSGDYFELIMQEPDRETEASDDDDDLKKSFQFLEENYWETGEKDYEPIPMPAEDMPTHKACGQQERKRKLTSYIPGAADAINNVLEEMIQLPSLKKICDAHDVDEEILRKVLESVLLKKR